MENLTKLNVLKKQIKEKLMVVSRCDPTRALETIWDLFVDHAPLT